MTRNEELIENKSKWAISAVALLFCLVWALIGEADIKIVAVTLAFIAFLKYGVATEVSSISQDGSH